MAEMFSGERLRADLRELQRLCGEMRPFAGGDAEAGVVSAAKSTPPPLCLNAELLMAVHERTLLAAGMLLHALEALPWTAVSPPPPCGCVSRPARLSAAPLIALLWEQVCRLKARCSQTGDAPGTESAGGPARGYCSRSAQTQASCLRRCEACCVAEAAVKALVEAFCSKLDEPSVAEQRSQVAASLCPGRLSQWGAMRALTTALCSDLDAVLCSKGAALAALEVERSASREASREAQQLAHLADRRAEQAEEGRSLAEESSHAARKRVSELESQERIRLEEIDRLRRALEAARGREADLQEQLQASRSAVEEVNAKLRCTEEELRRCKVHAEAVTEALKAEQSRLRKQVKHSQERHALLLKYPDLHGPLQPLQHEAGDPVLDMECQVQANEVRVSLLTTQNERLRATIAKLRVLAASGRPPTRNHSRPTSASSPCPSPSTPPGTRPISPRRPSLTETF